MSVSVYFISCSNSSTDDKVLTSSEDEDTFEETAMEVEFVDDEPAADGQAEEVVAPAPVAPPTLHPPEHPWTTGNLPDGAPLTPQEAGKQNFRLGDDLPGETLYIYVCMSVTCSSDLFILELIDIIFFVHGQKGCFVLFFPKYMSMFHSLCFC